MSLTLCQGTRSYNGYISMAGTGLNVSFCPVRREVFMQNRAEQAAVLSGLAPFQGISEKEIQREICPLVRLGKQKEGEFFYRAGDDCEATYFVVEGEVSLYRFSDSQRKVVLSNLGKDEFFGEQTLLAGKRNHASWAEAMADTICVEITRQNLAYLRRRFPSLTLHMYQGEQRKLGRALKTVRSIRLESVFLRVMRALLSTHDANQTTVLEDLGHQDIANMVGTNRETVTNILHELEERGLISKGRMQITLLDVEQLRQRLEED